MMRTYKPSDVSEVNNAAWDAVLPAFIGCIPCAALIASVLVTWLSRDEPAPYREAIPPWPLAWAAMIILSAVGSFYVERWHQAIQACKEFTRQMKIVAPGIVRTGKDAA